MQTKGRILLGLGLVGLLMAPATGAMTAQDNLIHRDRAYEETLRFEASADNNITPAKVIRWLCSMTGHAMAAAPSPAEFQPIVDVNEGRVRVIASINYKF